MQLTTKNIRREMKELEKCPMCGNVTEIAAYYGIDGEYKIKCGCGMCGTSADFVEWLILLEKKEA